MTLAKLIGKTQIKLSLFCLIVLLFSTKTLRAQAAPKFVFEIATNPFASFNKSKMKEAFSTSSSFPQKYTYSNERTSDGLSLSLSLDFMIKKNGVGLVGGIINFSELSSLDSEVFSSTSFTRDHRNKYDGYFIGFRYTRVIPINKWELLGNASLNLFDFGYATTDTYADLDKLIISNGIEVGIRKSKSEGLNVALFLTTNNFMYTIEENSLKSYYTVEGRFIPFHYGFKLALSYTFKPESHYTQVN